MRKITTDIKVEDDQETDIKIIQIVDNEGINQ
jgi:hypothetical protein